MPVVRYCSVAQKRDPVKGLILEYKAVNNLTVAKIAEMWGVSRATCSNRFKNEHSDKWLSEAKELCKKLGIPIEAFRAAVRY